MPAAKPLPEHVRDRTFRARRHHRLLAGPVVPWAELAGLQGRYVAATIESERRAIAVEFERAVGALHEARNLEAEDAAAAAELQAILTAPPVRVNPAGTRRAAERQARARQAEWRRADGWPLARIADRLGVSATTVRRDLTYLAQIRAGIDHLHIVLDAWTELQILH